MRQTHKRIVWLILSILVAMMVAMAGCGPQPSVFPTPTNSPEPAAEQETSTDTDADEADSDEADEEDVTPTADTDEADEQEADNEDTEEEQDSADAEGDEKEDHVVHWSYEGDTGPENWGDLSEEFETCATGESQSPIDIVVEDVVEGEDDQTLEIEYKDTPVTLTNNGHSIQVNYEPGSTITVDGQTYELLQFHFHNPSEHRVDGELATMELHLVHQDEDGNIAVIGVLLEEGDANEALAPFWGEWTEEEGEAELEDVTVNAADLLPNNKSYYTYEGSLTTPPCTEGVRWIMMTTPVEISEEQADTYAEILGGTNRPVQPLNGRVVTEY
jgi:carbonic anhydrase